MADQKVSIKRLVFLLAVVAVFLYTYMADLNIFAAVLRAISFSAPYVEHFILLFLILSFAGLSVYYYLVQFSHAEVSKRFLAWLKVFTWSFFSAFALSCLIVYLNIYFSKTFDI